MKMRLLIKRVVMTVLCAMTLSAAFPQTASHAHFLDIPIDGSVSDFIAGLEMEGFVETGNHYTGYLGDGVKAWVAPLVENGILYGVHVSFVDLYSDLVEATAMNLENMWELEEEYGIEFVEREPSSTDVVYMYFGTSDVAFILDMIQEVHEGQYGIDVTIIDIENGFASGYLNR